MHNHTATRLLALQNVSRMLRSISRGRVVMEMTYLRQRVKLDALSWHQHQCQHPLRGPSTRLTHATPTSSNLLSVFFTRWYHRVFTPHVIPPRHLLHQGVTAILSPILPSCQPTSTPRYGGSTRSSLYPSRYEMRPSTRAKL